jgi:hypothetical protein
MDWTTDLLDHLASVVPCGYHPKGPAASEPTALAGLALLAHGRFKAARAAADWLGQIQSKDGSVGVTALQPEPRWPTSLALLLWQASDRAGGSVAYADRIGRAVDWTLAAHGVPVQRDESIGHDTTLIGWSWAANTHSWLEPTALFTLALKVNGLGQHPRTREAVRLLLDRLLSEGGCNYGNTTVFGQELFPHVQPTGLVMLALAGESFDDPRMELSLDYLVGQLNAVSPTASLVYGLLGLAAHDRLPSGRLDWLRQAYLRVSGQDHSGHRLALIALALAQPNPLFPPETL